MNIKSLIFIILPFLVSCYRNIPDDEIVDSIVVESAAVEVPQQDFPHNLEYPSYSPDEKIVVHLAYTSSYNDSTLNPNWVAYELTAEELGGEFDSKPYFNPDPDLNCRQASFEDFSGTGWDKGHMAPRADMKWSEQVLTESYYFSNVCPQDHDMNAFDWCNVEKLARRMARQYGSVYIVCGPIFNQYEFGTIGEDSVMIPDDFFKALMVESGGTYHTIAFVVHNSPERHPMHEYICTVDDLEAIIQRDLFFNLPDDIEEDIECKVTRKIWGI